MINMDLNTWLRDFYPKILSDFGFSKEADERSAKILYELSKDKLLDCSVLRDKIANKRVAVIGGAVDIADVKFISELNDWVIMTSGKSVIKLKRLLPDLIPDVHVTDIEEPDDLLIDLEKNGCILVLHAHGDNIHRVKAVVPKLRGFIGTTQSIPFDRVYNFTGFTDGDRAAIIAKRFGAKEIKLYGFDFCKADDEVKLKKLKWAEKILKFEGII